MKDQTELSPESTPKFDYFGSSRIDPSLTEVIQISVVVPMFKVEDYLPALLESLAAQEPGNYELEYVFIDDGSPDASSALARSWMSQYGRRGLVLEKVNEGVSAARNDGIKFATGDWIIFPDSDDFLSTDFFANVALFFEQYREPNYNILANNVHRYWDVDGSFRNSHALKFKFDKGTDVVSLNDKPHYIQLQAASALFKRAFLLERNIEFKLGLHASEDALFVTEAILASDEPMLGINPNSIYYYRRRATGDSAVDMFSRRPETYFDRFENGFLEIIADLKTRGEAIPEWLMMLILYEFKWLFESETTIATKEAVLGNKGRVDFLNLVSRLLQSVTREAIENYRVTTLNWEIRVLLLALKGETILPNRVFVIKKDHERRLVQIKYWFVGGLPDENFKVGGISVLPSYSKVRSLDYFGQQALKQRIIWLALDGTLAVELDGASQEIRFGEPRVNTYALPETRVEDHFSGSAPLALNKLRQKYKSRRSLRWHIKRGILEWSAAKFAEKSLNNATPKELREARGRRFAQIRRVSWSQESQTLYSKAWVFSDRLLQGQDNAEHLYRWIQKHQPEINIWYVLKKECADWRRLERDGFKLVEFGSLEHYKLMLNAEHNISSHADYEMFEPIPERFYVNSVRSWKYTFLQHGVIKDDISIWLNSKKINLFITTTDAEQQSIAGDDTNYIFTEKVVKKTGLPRFDALLDKERAFAKDKLLVIPTWRSNALKPKVLLTGDRAVSERFTESEYFQQWQGLLTDKRLVEYAQESGLSIVFLPHPAMTSMLPLFKLPQEVTIASYSDGDVQDLFAQTQIAITDYSSVAFDLTYVGARVAYFQFDKDVIYGAGHTMREGYFSYEKDGFGPVGETREALFEGLTEIKNSSPTIYQERVQSLNWSTDGLACERVYESILELSRPFYADSAVKPGTPSRAASTPLVLSGSGVSQLEAY